MKVRTRSRPPQSGQARTSTEKTLCSRSARHPVGAGGFLASRRPRSSRRGGIRNGRIGRHRSSNRGAGLLRSRHHPCADLRVGREHPVVSTPWTRGGGTRASSLAGSSSGVSGRRSEPLRGRLIRHETAVHGLNALTRGTGAAPVPTGRPGSTRARGAAPAGRPGRDADPLRARWAPG